MILTQLCTLNGKWATLLYIPMYHSPMIDSLCAWVKTLRVQASLYIAEPMVVVAWGGGYVRWIHF